MNEGVEARAEPAGRARGLLLAVAIVLALRLIYLARFGWDGCWMNYNFLLEAKGYALGRPGEAHGLPLTPLLVWACRGAGLGPLAALGAIYLLAQALFTVSGLVLFDLFAPEATRRRRILFVVALAVLPMLSLDTGYKDLAVTLGAGLALAALAGALAAAAAPRPRPGLLAIAALCSALGALCRTEAAAVTGLMAVLLALARWSSPRVANTLPRRLAAASALLGGVALGVVSTVAISWRLRGVAQLGSPTYAFYTFYDGLPWLMRTGTMKMPGEYGRYLASVDLFGSFAGNHGSVAAALLAHPGKAVLRFLLKLPDLVAGASGPRALTPVGVLLAIVGVVRGRRGAVAARPLAPLLLAFAGAVAVLMIPPASDFYFQAALFPVLLAIAAGLDAVLARLSDQSLRRTAGAALIAAAGLIALVGRTEPSSSPAINEAAAYLETECRAGCLANYPPQSLAGLAWANLDAGAPFPEKIKRSEAFVTGNYPPGFAEGSRFATRLDRARAVGYRGPVLYLDVRMARARVFSDQFDPEHRLEGAVDLSGATLRRRFDAAGDTVAIYELPL